MSTESEFFELNALRGELRVRRSNQPGAIERFHDSSSGGFRSSQDRPPGKLSPSSTATCVTSLVETGQWPETDWVSTGPLLAQELLSGALTTKGLESGNVYTSAFVWEGAQALVWSADAEQRTPNPGFDQVAQSIRDREQDLEQELLAALSDGAVSLAEYPKSAYLTQLVVRVLLRAGVTIPTEIRERTEAWCWAELHRQVAFRAANLKSYDAFQLAYALVTLSQIESSSGATPDERRLLRFALDSVFESQLPDGTWPRSAPIFDLKGVGSSYCYEYEMLTQLLKSAALEDDLLDYLPNLIRAYRALLVSAYSLPDGVEAWASGHRPKVTGPESWATASAYNFIHGLERLVTEAIRRSVFASLRTPYIKPMRSVSDSRAFAPGLLDSQTKVDDLDVSVRDAVFDRFVRPVAEQSRRLERGLALPRSVPTTAIFFGPPGTSKTELSRAIADYLRWPRLVLDPSHFVRRGMDMVSAEADILFSMVESLERVVVLLDEIDEFVRERDGSGDFVSRFLTTTMLPKLAAISSARKIVFLVATNHIEQFDLAISRPGRFDLILQVMPPTLEAKCARWPQLDQLRRRSLDQDRLRKQELTDLTFDETRRLCGDGQHTVTVDDLDAVWHGATLHPPTGTGPKWGEICKAQAHYNRLPTWAAPILGATSSGGSTRSDRRASREARARSGGAR